MEDDGSVAEDRMMSNQAPVADSPRTLVEGLRLDQREFRLNRLVAAKAGG
jgi:hypothetical protein